MYTLQPKKMLIINILDILKRYTDKDHRLSQKKIAEILENEYNMKADRKAIKRNLMNLIDFGYSIEYNESTRLNKGGEEETLYTDWYIERDFSDAELRLLIDSLLFSKHIPYNQCKELIEKLEKLSNEYFKSKVKHIRNLPENFLENKQLFYNIEILDEAIEKNKQVQFVYNSYGIDKKMHPRLNSEGNPREYTVNPYQIVATNGRYYLICNYDQYDDLANCRVDRITNIKLLNSPAKPMKKVKGLENGLDLPKHMAEHLYMFTGESINVKFRTHRCIVGDIIDWFGSEVVFSNESGEYVDVRVKVNASAMYKWAIQYGEFVEILEPLDLRENVKKAVLVMMKHYDLSEKT